MASFDPNELIPIGEAAYPLTNWTDVKSDEVPDYVKQAIARGNYPALGLSPEILKDVQFGSWDLNGQKNYGFKIKPDSRIEIMDGDNRPSGVFMDRSGNILGGNNALSTFGVQAPWSQSAIESADRSLYLRPTFYGQTIEGGPGGTPAYSFDASGAGAPTTAMVDYANRAQKAADIAGRVSPLAYLAPLFPIAIGLGAGALGGTAALGGGAASAAEGLGAGAAGGLGAAEGAGAAGGAAGGAGLLEGSAPLTILSSVSEPVATGAVGGSGAIGGGASLGAAPLASSGAAGGGLGLGTAASGAAASEAGGLGGILSGINSSIAGGIESALAPIVGGETAATIAPIASKAVIGAVGNGLVSGVTGGDPLKGALTGALTGGALGWLGGADGLVSNALGIGQKFADPLIGAATGGLGALATKQNPLIGALSGAGAGYLNATMDPTASVAAGGVDALSGGKGGLLSGKGGISGSALALGALAAGAGALGNKNKTTVPTTASTSGTPGPESVSNTLGPYFNQPLNPNFPGRMVVNPYEKGVPNYWTYGSSPEPLYFQNNSLKSFGFGYADGGQVYPTDDGREFSTEYGDTHVRGPGTGTSDSIAARLSDGEYVLDYRDVSDIGGGNNDKGAKKLDRLRRSGALAKILSRA